MGFLRQPSSSDTRPGHWPIILYFFSLPFLLSMMSWRQAWGYSATSKVLAQTLDMKQLPQEGRGRKRGETEEWMET